MSRAWFIAFAVIAAVNSLITLFIFMAFVGPDDAVGPLLTYSYITTTALYLIGLVWSYGKGSA